MFVPFHASCSKFIRKNRGIQKNAFSVEHSRHLKNIVSGMDAGGKPDLPAHPATAVIDILYYYGASSGRGPLLRNCGDALRPAEKILTPSASCGGTNNSRSSYIKPQPPQ